MIEVLEILPGSRAIVSTEGLRRVTLRQSNRVIGELMPPDEAAAMADAVNECGVEARAEACPYCSVAHIAVN